MKILTIIGARPQFVKAATVSWAIDEFNCSVEKQDKVEEIIVHTGQHYDKNMSDVFFEQMSIPKPDYHLGIGGGSHGKMTGQQLEKIEEVLLVEKPDWVLVYGDTNSTLAGALAAAKLKIPIAHVEAGLRSFNMAMPEEINRILTDRISTLLFCPTELSVQNLITEGFTAQQTTGFGRQGHAGSAVCKVCQVGDVMYDAALFYKNKAVKPVWLDDLGLDNFVLCTIHRAENTDCATRLSEIFRGLGDTGLPVVLPLHPRTRAKLSDYSMEVAGNIHLVDPVGYLEMVWLEANCSIIATDSGGVQKEAYFHGKPCVTLRDETEWVELVEAGWNRLSGANGQRVADMILSAHVPEEDSNLYGCGDAAMKIVEILVSES